MSIRRSLSAVLLAALVAPVALTQDGLPSPSLSPPVTWSQTVGVTPIAMAYGAPSVRGRTIMGDKVPHGVVWRAGANATTWIEFGTDVSVAGEDLPAGRYGLHLIPGETAWTVIFNAQHDAWGSYSYDPAQDVLRVDVDAESAPFREQLRFSIEDVTDDGATLLMHWETTALPIPVGFDLPALVLEPAYRLAAADDDGPGWQFWFEAAVFGDRHGVGVEHTLDWVERSVAVYANFSNLWLQADLLRVAGRDDEAARAQAAAVDKQPTVDDLQGLAYRYHQKGDFANAEKIFSMVVGSGSAGWWAWSMLAEVRVELGDEAGAAEALRGALAAGSDPVTASELEARLAKLES